MHIIILNSRLFKVNLYLAFLFFSNQIYSQENLVPNPSFEEVIGCQDSIRVFLDNAKSWYSVNWTPDIFHSCYGSGEFTSGVPINNFICYQWPRSGLGYGGLVFGVEYLGNALTKKLTENADYYIRFFVVANNCKNSATCYTNGAGLAFADSTYTYGSNNVPPQFFSNFQPAVENPRTNILRDTLNWQKVSGCYTAEGWEKDIIIGNFISMFGGEFISMAEDGTMSCSSFNYYYIDDVEVYEFNPLPDTLLICNNEKLKLGSKFLDATYKWNTGDTDSVIYATESGEYQVTASIDGCVFSDSIVVINVDSEINSLVTDTSFCKNEGALKLQFNIPGEFDFIWSDGLFLNDNEIVITKTGIYNISVANSCGNFNHNFKVKAMNCSVYIPNIFTPNSDGVNDIFQPLPASNLVKISSIEIYDRWGTLLFRSTPLENNRLHWDGRFKNKLVADGTYIYRIKYYLTNNMGELKIISGDITIKK